MAAHHASSAAAAAAALLLLMLAAPILEASGSEQANTGTARTRTRERAPLTARVRCTEVHGVKAGETCGSLARAFGFTEGGLRLLNPNITCADLFPGQWVCVAGSGVA